MTDKQLCAAQRIADDMCQEPADLNMKLLGQLLDTLIREREVLLGFVKSLEQVPDYEVRELRNSTVAVIARVEAP